MSKNSERSRRNEGRSWWQGLRFLSISWTIAPLTLMLILAIGVTGVALLVTARSQAETQNLTLVRLSAARLNDNLARYTHVLTKMADQLGRLDLNTDQASSLFQLHSPFLADLTDGGDLLVLDANGVVVASYPYRPELSGQNYAAHPYFQRLHLSTDKVSTFFDVLSEPETGRQMIGQATPIVNEANQFSGILISRFYLDTGHFGRSVQLLAPESEGETYLVDGNGVVIFHPNSHLIGQDFSAQPAVSSLRQTRQTGAYLVQSSGAPQTFVAYAPVDSAGWGLIITEPWSQVVGPVQGALLFITGVLFLGLLALILLALWAIRRITQPLNRLVVQARQAAAGAYDSQVDLSRIREIRELGQAFNHLVSQVSSYRSGLQEYVASVTDSQEEERRRIARDLHDGTIQTLIAIVQRIELARIALEEQSLEQNKQQLTEVRSMVTEAIASIRQFSQDLRPLTLEDLGLVPALHHLIIPLDQKKGITAELRIEGDATGLSQDLETAIFRITQETLSNIRKHAHATQVMVTIRFLPRQTILEVQDNGIGFDVPENTTDLATKGSFGLLGLEERAGLFGGDISIQSAIKQGTIVRVILPHKQLPRRRENRLEVDNNLAE